MQETIFKVREVREVREVAVREVAKIYIKMMLKIL